MDGDEPPFLLVHGDRDRVVAERNSVALASRLRAAGRPATLLRLPGGSHFTTIAAFYQPQRAPRVLPAILAFVGASQPARTLQAAGRRGN